MLLKTKSRKCFQMNTNQWIIGSNFKSWCHDFVILSFVLIVCDNINVYLILM